MRNLSLLAMKNSSGRAAAIRQLAAWKEQAGRVFFGEEGKEEVEVEGMKFSRESFSGEFEAAERELREAEPLYLYLAKPVTGQEASDLVALVREKLGENLLVEVETDGALLGGCALAFGGKYCDFSIRGRMKENEGRIAQVVREGLSGGRDQ